jgi:hypothetical protein
MPDDEGEEIHFEIFYADLPDLAAPAAAQRLTHNDYTDQNAYIAGPHVVFASLVPDLDVPACLGPFLTDFEVFYANLDLDDGAGTPLLWRVTQNDADDVNPRVRGPAPQVDERVAIFWEVLVFDRVDLLTLDAQALSISSPPPPGIRLSIDSVDQFSGFDISESLVVWTEVVNDEPPEGDEESDPAENLEIFSAPLVEVPEPGPIARTLAALGSMALFAAIRRRALSR